MRGCAVFYALKVPRFCLLVAELKIWGKSNLVPSFEFSISDLKFWLNTQYFFWLKYCTLLCYQTFEKMCRHKWKKIWFSDFCCFGRSDISRLCQLSYSILITETRSVKRSENSEILQKWPKLYSQDKIFRWFVSSEGRSEVKNSTTNRKYISNMRLCQL